MSFQICLKTDKPLQQLAADICKLFSLPPYKQDTFAGEPYYQFEMLGMLVLVHQADEEDRDPEVMRYPYCFDLSMTFTDTELNADELEYRLQPYYAQLLSFHLGIETAHHEKQKVNQRWQIRYRFYSKNTQWDGTILFGEEGWQPAVIEKPPSMWRHMHPVF